MKRYAPGLDETKTDCTITKHKEKRKERNPSFEEHGNDSRMRHKCKDT